MTLLCYRCKPISFSINKNIDIVKRFYSISNNYSNNVPYYEYRSKKFLNHRTFNSHLIQKSSFHSLFEGYVRVFQSLSQSDAVVATQNFLVSVHDTSGLPWWATVVVSTIALRSTITIPLALYQQYILAKIENLKTELTPLVKELQKEMSVACKMYNWSPSTASIVYQRSLKKQWTILIERDNCHPAKASIIVLFQLPMWILLSMSIRNLVSMQPFKDDAASMVFDQLKHEGLLWIPDLTLVDNTMITSTLLCLVSLSIVEVNRLMLVQESSSKLRSILINASRLFALITFPFALIVPSCLSFYWLTSATFGLIQNLIVMSPRLKLLVGIPRTPTTLQRPYRHLWKRILETIKFSKERNS